MPGTLQKNGDTLKFEAKAKRQLGWIATSVFNIYYNLITHYRSSKEIHEVSSDLQQFREELAAKIKIKSDVDKIIEKELTTLAKEQSKLHQQNTDLLHFVIVCNRITQLNANLLAIQRLQAASNQVDLAVVTYLTGIDFGRAKNEDTAWRSWVPDHWTDVMDFEVTIPSDSSVVLFNCE